MKNWLIVILLYSFATGLHAQSLLRLQHFNVNDGLSQSSVNYIFQDNQGFMWFATGDGLDRYDGKEFVAHKSKFHDTTGAQLQTRNINTTIFEDKYHRFWLSIDAGICFWDWRKRHFKVAVNKFTAQNNAYIAAIEGDYIWAIVPQSGYYRVNINTLKTDFYPFTDPLQHSKETAFIVSSAANTANQLWIVDKAGLICFDKNKHTDERIFSDIGVTSTTKLQNGNLLLAGTGGVYFFNPITRTKEFFPIKNEAQKEATIWKSVVEDTIAHTVYIGAYNHGSVCKLDLATREYEILNFQKTNINTMYIDRSQNLWIGTEGNGTFKLDIKPLKFNCFTPYPSEQLTEANTYMVKSVYGDDSGNIWMGTFDNGLAKYTPKSKKLTQIKLPFETSEQLISGIIKDSSNALVVAMGSNLIWLDPKSHRILNTKHLPESIHGSYGSPIIQTLTEWKKGYYLAGTNMALFPFNTSDGAETKYPAPYMRETKEIDVWMYNIHKEINGTLYLGKRNGFTKIRMVNDSLCDILDDGLHDVVVRHFYKCVNNPILWIATEKGLVAYNETTKKYKVFDESSGLANSSVYGVLAENDSSLWVSTNLGLSNVKVHYKDLTNITASFTNYTAKDGLQSNEFNTGAFCLCADGTMIFGGIAGINWFDPKTIKPNPYKATPIISAIYINDQLLAGDSSTFMTCISMPYNRNTIGLSLRALEYTRPEQNQFAYRMKGLENDWVYTTNDKVRYSNLNPGSYTFLLRVSNNEGVWNDTPLELGITILPPWWQTWWFYTIATILIAAVVSIVVRLYVRQKVRKKTRELEQQHALYLERMRISKDVHDDLGSGLSKISLMADAAQQKASSMQAVDNDIKHISDISKSLVENMRDLIWVLNPDNTTLDNLVSRLREYSTDYLDNLPIDVVINFPDQVPAIVISREVQRNIFLTVKESINNCIKHSRANKVIISLRFENENMNIEVADNGKGIDSTTVRTGGNGLRNMKQRIETIGGIFEIKSAPDSGTSVNIKVPFAKLDTQSNLDE